MTFKKSLFQKVGKTPIVPITVKILAVFVTLLLLSNFTTNYINILMNRKETIRLTNELLVGELKDLYTNAGNQYEIFLFSKDRDSALKAIASSAEKDLQFPSSRALGITAEGEILIQVSPSELFAAFPDTEALSAIAAAYRDGVQEGSFFFNSPAGEYFGIYKYQDEWDCFFIRADLMSDMLAATNRVFFNISFIIIILVIVFMVIGLFILTRIMRFIQKISSSLYEMQGRQVLSLIDLEGAPNDDITYLGASFNSLSSSINNLLGIFRKFVSKDVVTKAYREHRVNLEGMQKELTILFSDIRGFTYMTETLGNDIINLLNVHYDRAIHVVHERQGIIGSIIGDALLAVFGTLEGSTNKSLASVEAAWRIHDVVFELRSKMVLRKNDIESLRALTEAEERVFKAVLLDVGVGIDGGTVFYGNIGSSEHMTNTVIGDNVNSASRLEGLTRIYHLPIIVSSYIKGEIEQISDRYMFIEIDTVQVKGKTEGKKVYFPADMRRYSARDMERFAVFSQGLESYYAGDWKKAYVYMKDCALDVAQVFIERVENNSLPENWSGIWTMTTK